MARRPFFPPRRQPTQSRKKKAFILERTSAEEIRRIKLFGRAYLRLTWDYYSELAFQRAQISDCLSAALLEASGEDYEFHRWQRVVKLKYGLRPLSVAGSLKDPGGRFNIGDIDQSRYQAFPALYLAGDRATALQETFGKEAVGGDDQLSFALTRPDSIVAVSISGKIDSVLDLNKPERLERFVDLIRTFEISEHLRKRAQALRVTLPCLITSVEDLIRGVLAPNWRLDSMGLDVPSPCQILGQMVANAGIAGILFPSKYSGVGCLAVYPQNFKETESWVQLDDEAPAEMAIRRIDADVWEERASDLSK
ncbi:MAG: RES family NAD+ phosphorylase [Elusimicrobiota bacterium]|jgi:hypothetical protein